MELKNIENKILEQLNYIKSDKEILHKLKLFFSKKIKSKRTFARISDYCELFKVLIKRNAISYDYLKSFNLALDSKEDNCNLEQEFLNVTSTNTTAALLPFSSLQHENGLGNSHINIRNEQAASIFSQRQDFQNMVVMEISDKIGSKWRNLARYLDFKEKIIDQVEVEYTHFKDKAYQILTMSLAQFNFENWTTKLIYALGKVRRKDLGDWVQDNYKVKLLS